MNLFHVMFFWDKLVSSLFSSSLVSTRKNNNCKRHLHRQSSNTSAKTNSLLFFQISFICYKEKTIDEIRWDVTEGNGLNENFDTTWSLLISAQKNRIFLEVTYFANEIPSNKALSSLKPSSVLIDLIERSATSKT